MKSLSGRGRTRTEEPTSSATMVAATLFRFRPVTRTLREVSTTRLRQSRYRRCSGWVVFSAICTASAEPTTTPDCSHQRIDFDGLRNLQYVVPTVSAEKPVPEWLQGRASYMRPGPSIETRAAIDALCRRPRDVSEFLRNLNLIWENIRIRVTEVITLNTGRMKCSEDNQSVSYVVRRVIGRQLKHRRIS